MLLIFVTVRQFLSKERVIGKDRRLAAVGMKIGVWEAENGHKSIYPQNYTFIADPSFMITKEAISSARQLWDYLHLHHIPERSDCILVLGSQDLRVADRGAELYLQGLAPILIFSGGQGKLTKDWKRSEADLFAAIALDRGVPAEAIFIENRSTNTGENILFTRQLLEANRLDPQRFLLVQKPYMERRSYATFMQQWPGKKLIVTSPQISFEDYPTEDIPMERVINIMVGDLQRIRDYPAKGFQIFQEIPADIWKAWERLVELGFTGHLAL